MELQNPLHTIASTVDTDVLTVLARADSEFTVAMLKGIIETRSYEGIRKALERLNQQGVVVRRRLGRAHGYSLNRDHLAAPAIIDLARLSSRLFDRIRERIESWGEPPVYAAVFGSAARGEMRWDSDIDIFLVRDQPGGSGWYEQVDALANDMTSWTGNDTRVLDVLVDEISGRAREDAVLLDIARDGLTVHGEPTLFRRIVGA